MRKDDIAKIAKKTPDALFESCYSCYVLDIMACVEAEVGSLATCEHVPTVDAAELSPSQLSCLALLVYLEDFGL